MRLPVAPGMSHVATAMLRRPIVEQISFQIDERRMRPVILRFPYHAAQDRGPLPAGIIDEAANPILLSIILPPSRDYQ